MRLYTGNIEQFIDDTTRNEIAERLSKAYEDYYGHRANPREVVSWTNSLQFLKNVLEPSSPKENMMILEYELPYSSNRIDCILFGRGSENEDNVVVMELKQWSAAKSCDVEGNVMTFVGGAERMEAHPSYQVRNYHLFLEDFVQMFQEKPKVTLSSCCYCHNYSRKGNGVLFSTSFENVTKDFPIFAKEDFASLCEYLKKRLQNGRGTEIFNRFADSKIKPSKKLMEHAKNMIRGESVFRLIDDQITANNTIIDRAKKASKIKKKSVIIVRGGPGTGKSVIALNALVELLSKGLTVFHSTGSAAFTTTLRTIAGYKASGLFKYFNSFAKADENSIDVMVCDEAHRIRKTSNSRFTRRESRSELSQMEELIRVAKVSIFFIDDHQVVRPTEIGSVDLIKETAKKFDAEIFDFELKTQFRCAGSNGYLNWIENTLGITETANVFLTKDERMEFKIFDSPAELYEAIKKKNEEKTNSARLVAGFCWNWSDPNPDGTLKEDIIIGDFRATWEAKNEARKLAPGIPKAALWAYDPNGVNQVGSIYTIQGFEFDYVGVIVGKDMIYNPVKKEWIGIPNNSADNSIKGSKEEFLRYVKNVYRVLMTRGMKGCYVYFMDKETEKFFKSRIQTDLK